MGIEHTGFTPGPWSFRKAEEHDDLNTLQCYAIDSNKHANFALVVARFDDDEKDSVELLATVKTIADAPRLVAENVQLREEVTKLRESRPGHLVEMTATETRHLVEQCPECWHEKLTADLAQARAEVAAWKQAVDEQFAREGFFRAIMAHDIKDRAASLLSREGDDK